MVFSVRGMMTCSLTEISNPKASLLQSWSLSYHCATRRNTFKAHSRTSMILSMTYIAFT
jgi:hypothetical protein